MYCGLDGVFFTLKENPIEAGDGDVDDEMIFLADDVIDPIDDDDDDDDDKGACDTFEEEEEDECVSLVRPTRLLALVLAFVKRTSSISSGPIPVKEAKRFILADRKGPSSTTAASLPSQVLVV